MYKVVWKEETKKDLAKIDHAIVKKITDKVENYLIQDPLSLGERLLYDWKGHYRYRIGDYRVIYKVKELEILILVVKVGHRKEIY
jgi:mRNA interferase RelE/StbE